MDADRWRGGWSLLGSSSALASPAASTATSTAPTAATLPSVTAGVAWGVRSPSLPLLDALPSDADSSSSAGCRSSKFTPSASSSSYVPCFHTVPSRMTTTWWAYRRNCICCVTSTQVLPFSNFMNTCKQATGGNSDDVWRLAAVCRRGYRDGHIRCRTCGVQHGHPLQIGDHQTCTCTNITAVEASQTWPGVATRQCLPRTHRHCGCTVLAPR